MNRFIRAAGTGAILWLGVEAILWGAEKAIKWALTDEEPKPEPRFPGFDVEPERRKAGAPR